MQNLYAVNTRWGTVAFDDRGLAEIAGRGQGDWGSDHAPNVVHYFQSGDEYTKWLEGNVRAKALGKLSEEERRVLGL